MWRNSVASYRCGFIGAYVEALLRAYIRKLSVIWEIVQEVETKFRDMALIRNEEIINFIRMLKCLWRNDGDQSELDSIKKSIMP